MTEGTDGVSFELALDLRRFLLMALFTFLIAVLEEPSELSLSLLLELEEESELEEFKMSAKTPG